jgi:DNA-binding Lrp family transcriptional regulator
MRCFDISNSGEITVVFGFVLIRVSPMQESEVFNKLSKLHEVIEFHSVFKEYDLIAKIEAKDYESIEQIVINKIKTINGILETKILKGAGLQ